MKTKICPICKKKKPVSEFGLSWDKRVQKYAPRAYCKICEVSPEGLKRKREYVQRNRDKVLAVRRKYWNKNRARIRELNNKISVRKRKELTPAYVAAELATRSKVKVEDIKKVPGIIEAYTELVKLKRIIRNEKHR